MVVLPAGRRTMVFSDESGKNHRVGCFTCLYDHLFRRLLFLTEVGGIAS